MRRQRKGLCRHTSFFFALKTTVGRAHRAASGSSKINDMFDIAAIQKLAAQALRQDGLSLLLPPDLTTLPCIFQRARRRKAGGALMQDANDYFLPNQSRQLDAQGQARTFQIPTPD